MSRQKIIDTAAAQVGTKENPPDSNITPYGAWYGENGVKWCAIFVSWVYAHAGCPLGYIDSPNGYASCQDGYDHWKKTGELTKTPEMGDIVLYDWDWDGHCDHTGIFNKWIQEGVSFESYEGNTSAGNNSNGGEVMLRTRSIKFVKAFASPRLNVFNAGWRSQTPVSQIILNPKPYHITLAVTYHENHLAQQQH